MIVEGVRSEVFETLDETLVQRALTGDTTAFREIYDRHHAYIGNIAWRLLRRPELVEDVVQETFLIAFETMGRLRERARLRPWLGAIVTRRAGRIIDRQQRRRALRRLIPARSEHSLDRADESSTLYEALDNLPAQVRTPWILARIEGIALAEVAELCTCSLATAKRRIAKAQAQLERSYAP